MKSPKKAPVISLSEIRARRVDLSKGTLQEAWNIYEASLALDRLKPTSRAVYRYAAKLAIENLPPRPRLGDVTLWLESLVRDGLAPSTVNKYLRALKAIVERADNLSAGGAARLRTAFRAQRNYKIPAKLRRDAQATTVKRLLELCKNKFELLAVRLAAFYGLRRGEILALRPENYRRNVMTVTHTRDSYGYRPRKNAENQRLHVLALQDDAVTHELVTTLCNDVLRLEMAHRNQRNLAVTYLIPWGPEHMQRLINEWRKDPDVYLPRGDAWHAMRHYGATQLASVGASTLDVQNWLGDVTTTAAMCYIGQVRGSTEGSAKKILQQFELNLNNPPQD